MNEGVVNFNSSMVRLKGSRIAILNSDGSDFNSSMVRLKVPYLTDYSNQYHISIPVWCDWKYTRSISYDYSKEFQFQYGAIESTMILQTYNPHYPISIPVWCDWKVHGRTVKSKEDRDFNSSMVRLKAAIIPTKVQVRAYFNSSMVRLKGAVYVDVYFVSLFQFQYGAIESVFGCHLNNLFHVFQFQYGAIESMIVR